MAITKKEDAMHTMNITVDYTEDLSEVFADSPKITVSSTADMYSTDFAIDEVTWKGETYRLSDAEHCQELGDALLCTILRELQAKVTEEADWKSREAIQEHESGADRADILCSGGY